MRNVLGIEQREHVGDAKPIVGAKRRAFGSDAVAVDLEGHALPGEIVRHALVDLTHHIEVAVQDDRRRRLVAGRARFLHDDVLKLIAVMFEPAFYSEVCDVVGCLLFTT